MPVFFIQNKFSKYIFQEWQVFIKQKISDNPGNILEI